MAKKLHYNFAGRPSLAGHDSFTSTPGTPDLSLTRATTAWMKDADGWLREVQIGEARFPGAAFSHNLGLQSENVASWPNNTNVSVTDDQDSITVNGQTIQLSEIADDATNGLHWARYANVVTNEATAGKIRLHSFYVKAGTARYVWSGPISTQVVIWDLQTATITVQEGPIDDAGIDDLGNGYYRVWFTTDTANGAYDEQIIGIGSDGTEVGNTYVGTGDTIYAGGFQIEIVDGKWDSENLLLQSNQFDTSWTNLSSSETSGIADPDGGTNAWSVNEDATAAAIHTILQNKTLDSPGRYLVSVYAKASNRSWLYIQLNGYAGGTPAVNYDLTNGVLGSQSGVVSAGIQDAGNGWYRCWAIADIVSNDVAGSVRFFIGEANNDITFDGLDQESILIYKAQFERTKPNQTAPGPYTATTTAAVTNYSPSTYIATTSAAVSSLSGANDGLLVEESRTNIKTYSENTGGESGWTNNLTACVADVTIAPDGSLTGNKVQDDGLTGSSSSVYMQGGATTLTVTTAYVLSVFAKADQLGWLYLALGNYPAGYDCYFDLTTGAVGTAGVNVTDTGIEDYGNGWYRCWFSFTSDGTDTSMNIRVGPADADNDNTILRDTTSSIFAWGAQLEAGAFPTAYIPTTTGTVTRNVDEVSTADLSWYTQEVGSWYVDSVCNYDESSTSVAMTLFRAHGGSTNYVALKNDLTSTRTGEPRLLVRNSSAHSLLGLDNQVSSGVRSRYAGAIDFNADEAALYTDGVLQGTASGWTTTPPTPSSFYVGAGTSGLNNINGLIKEIAYADERISDANLSGVSGDTLSVEQALGGNPAYIRKKARQRWRARYGRT